MKYLILFFLMSVTHAQVFTEHQGSVSGVDPHGNKKIILKALRNANAECFKTDYSSGVFRLSGEQLKNHFVIGNRNVLINKDVPEPYIIMEYWWEKNYARTDFYLNKELTRIKAFRDIRIFSENNPIVTGMLAPVEDINNGSVFVQADITCYINYP